MSRPIHGMPEVFQYLATRLKPKFFYLSAGPSLLRFYFISFINFHYPLGRIFLAPWNFSVSLLIGSKVALINYKSERLDLIFRSEKGSKVLCIGDDSQEDLEVYMRADEMYPGWIERIFIRETGVCQRRTRTKYLLIQSPSQRKVEFFATAEELRTCIESLPHG